MKNKSILIPFVMLLLALPFTYSYTAQHLYNNAILLWQPTTNLSIDGSLHAQNAMIYGGNT